MVEEGWMDSLEGGDGRIEASCSSWKWIWLMLGVGEGDWIWVALGVEDGDLMDLVDSIVSMVWVGLGVARGVIGVGWRRVSSLVTIHDGVGWHGSTTSRCGFGDVFFVMTHWM